VEVSSTRQHDFFELIHHAKNEALGKKKFFGAPRATWNSGLLDANLPVILLSQNHAKVSQDLVVEVAVP